MLKKLLSKGVFEKSEFLITGTLTAVVSVFHKTPQYDFLAFDIPSPDQQWGRSGSIIIMITCLCNKLQFFTAVKKLIFSSPEPKAHW